MSKIRHKKAPLMEAQAIDTIYGGAFIVDWKT